MSYLGQVKETSSSNWTLIFAGAVVADLLTTVSKLWRSAGRGGEASLPLEVACAPLYLQPNPSRGPKWTAAPAPFEDVGNKSGPKWTA